MSEETTDQSTEEVTDNSAELEQLRSDNASMKAKMDELLTEAKKAKAAKRQVETEAQQEQERIAQQQGDYEQLHKSSVERYEATVEELNALRGTIAKEKQNNVAMKLNFMKHT